MRILRKPDILALLDSQEDKLRLDPLLDRDAQVGEVSLDLRLGCDFCVSVLTRNPSIDVRPCENGGKGVATHFQSTRRDLGDKFILYPGQIVVGTTLEYISLPRNILAEIGARSSYSRLGINIHSFTQPGYRGCISIEIFNHGNIPVELVVGSRLLQARLYELDGTTSYGADRKYFACVRPTLSKAEADPEIVILTKSIA